jgi:hypothetical protein
MSQYSHQNASISFAGASEGAAGCCSVIGGGNGEGAASAHSKKSRGKKAFCSFKRKEVPVAGDSAAGGAAGEAGAVSSAAAGDGEGGVWSAGCTCYESHQYKKNTHTHTYTQSWDPDLCFGDGLRFGGRLQRRFGRRLGGALTLRCRGRRRLRCISAEANGEICAQGLLLEKSSRRSSRWASQESSAPLPVPAISSHSTERWEEFPRIAMVGIVPPHFRRRPFRPPVPSYDIEPIAGERDKDSTAT